MSTNRGKHHSRTHFIYQVNDTSVAASNFFLRALLALAFLRFEVGLLKWNVSVFYMPH